MSDEMWRRREREQRDPAEDFGGPLFPDADPAAATDRPDDTGERRLSFGPDDPTGDHTGDADLTGEVRADSLSEPLSRPPTGEVPMEPPRREPGRITIGTDPSGVPRRPPQGSRRRGAAAQTRSGRPAGPAR